MSLTPSQILPLGRKALDFTLPNAVDGKNITLEEMVSNKKGFLVCFICNHCPYVIHIQDQLISIAHEYMEKGIAFFAINSNNWEQYPDDHPEKMKELALKKKMQFPYLVDETQEVARLYDAVCTPDFFLFNEKKELVYGGQFDQSRPSNDFPITGDDLRKAMDVLLSGEEPLGEQVPSTGCNIKWK